MHALKLRTPTIFLALALLVSGCCDTIAHETAFDVTEDEAARPCDDFCEKVIPGDEELLSCKLHRIPDESPTIVCAFGFTYCQEPL